MTHTATPRPHSSTGRRRVPAVIALAMAAGVVLAGCSADPDTAAPTTPTTQSTTSSSSTTTSPSPTTETAAPVSAPATTAPPAAPAPQVSTQLPANVVSTGGPCHLLGDLAQAQDGSALLCLDDPGGAGPLWLPQPEAGPDATGAAMQGRPCIQEGAAITAPEGTVLTCRLTGGGDVPGGLFWQQ